MEVGGGFGVGLKEVEFSADFFEVGEDEVCFVFFDLIVVVAALLIQF